jgi:uracil-DNA glycosylase
MTADDVTDAGHDEPLTALAILRDEVVACRRCPRLVACREEVALTKRAAFVDQHYSARPLPGFGDADARVLLLGLAPAAHGGNRTGRVFTGDRSGDWLFAALWRAGYANQPESRSLDDGLTLQDAYVTAAVRCAPPANRPTSAERDACEPYLRRELALLVKLRVIVALGGFAHEIATRELGLRPRPRFGHGAETTSADGIVLLDSYHPSQRNTSTRLLTASMLDDVFRRARELADQPARRVGVEPEGGDAACWAHLVCPQCGSMMDDDVHAVLH